MRRDTPESGRLLVECSGGSLTASVSHKARKTNKFSRLCAKMFSPSAHRKEKEQVYFPALFLWRRRRDTAASGRLLAACSGGSLTHRCNSRLVRRTDFCACAQKCSHPPYTAKKKSTTRVLFSLAEKEGFEPSLRFYPYYSLSRGAP